MKYVIHRNSNGWITDTYRIYEDGEKPDHSGDWAYLVGFGMIVAFVVYAWNYLASAGLL